MTPVGVFLIYPNEDKCYFVNTPGLSRINIWISDAAMPYPTIVET